MHGCLCSLYISVGDLVCASMYKSTLSGVSSEIMLKKTEAL